MQFNVLGACSGLGQKLTGLEAAPDLIRENGFLRILKEANVNFSDLGNVVPDATGNIWSFLQRLKQTASNHIAENQILFNLGGDHSIAMATVGATLEKFPEARLMWIDAHGDINTPASSLTGNLHGMPLAAILGMFKTELNTTKLKKENLILIGVRDLDLFEQDLLDFLNVQIITAKEIIDDPAVSLSKIINWIKLKETPLHLSFDIDSVDPKTAPATGLKVASGLNKNFTLDLIKQISLSQKVVAIDLVELNPNQAQCKAEVDSTLEVFFEILKIFIQSNSSKVSSS